MTPEQREQLKQWAQDYARRNPGAMPPGHERPNSGTEPGREQAGLPPGAGEGDQPGSERPTADARGSAPHGPDGRGSGLNLPGTQARGNPSSGERAAAPSRTETVDARPPTPAERSARQPERVIAEWYGPGAKGQSTLTPEAQRSVQDAVRGGERAIDDRAVAPRFDRLLERYFRRLPGRAQDPSATATDGGAATPPAPTARPAEPARDAP